MSTYYVLPSLQSQDVVTLLATKFTHSFLFTPRNRDLPVKLIQPQLTTKFPAFYIIRRCIIAFTTACHLSLSWASRPSLCPRIHFSKVHFNIILPSAPGSPKWSPSLRFPYQNPVSAPPLFSTCCISNQSDSSFDHSNNTWWGVGSINLFVI
jgi:hypothetical protein